MPQDRKPMGYPKRGLRQTELWDSAEHNNTAYHSAAPLGVRIFSCNEGSSAIKAAWSSLRYGIPYVGWLSPLLNTPSVGKYKMF
jgi:hypothetical protein